MAVTTRRDVRAPWKVLAAIFLLLAGLFALPNAAQGAPSAIYVNAGGTAQTVAGTSWKACTTISNCSGYVSGGNAYTESSGSAPTGYPSNTTAAMHRTEWTGGRANGLPAGATAFTFTLPAESGVQYDLKLHFTEMNKFKSGARVFDVKVNGAAYLTNFDVWAAAGGAYKTIVRTTRTTPVNGKVTIAFIARVENAKVDAIELVPVAPTGTTTTTTQPATTTTTVPATTTTTAAPTTTTTSAPTTTTTTVVPGTNKNSVTWSGVADSPFAAVESTGGFLNGKIYSFGGMEDPSWYDVRRQSASYDTATGQWKTLTPAPTPMSHTAIVADGNSFILLGGVTNDKNGVKTYSTRDTYRYDTITDKWTSFTPLPVARASGNAALIGRTLHFFGGVDVNRKEYTDHWTINLDNLAAGWAADRPLPVGRSHFASHVVGTQIYMIGGQTGWDETARPWKEVYRYDTVSKQWSTMASMPTELSHIETSIARIGNELWVFGGEHVFAQNGTRDIYIYNLDTNTWRKSPSQIPAKRQTSIVGVVGDTVFLTFGEWTSTKAWKGSLK
jgi:N-acetylneuraminic acid mutarotase